MKNAASHGRAPLHRKNACFSRKNTTSHGKTPLLMEECLLSKAFFRVKKGSLCEP